jgi:lactate racemase
MAHLAPDREIALPYGDRSLRVRLPARQVRAVLSPRPVSGCAQPADEIRRALGEPIGASPLQVTARGARRAVIVADDLTRQTPVHLIVPILLDELNACGVQDSQVSVLIALGTHRPMTPAEIRARFGPDVTGRVPVLNHRWDDPAQLVDLGTTANATPIQVNRLAVEADLLLGLGSIVPHHIPGYAGGAKIVQPGISGPATTGATHFLSTRSRRSYLGQADNPVREEMEAIAGRVGLDAILNVVLNANGQLVRAFYGAPRAAHRAGVTCAREVYGVALPGTSEIVIAGSHPCDSEFWQAHKALYPADLAVKAGGTVIVVAPCPEGVSATHADMLNFTALDAATIECLILDGTIRDTVSGALALAWAKMRERATIALVSDGIPRSDALALGFTPYASVADAVQDGLRRYGPAAGITVLTHAPDMLPLT